MAFNAFMHARNIYKERPDFSQIAKDYPELQKFAIPNKKGKVHIDFSSTEALRAVTKVLLKKDFNLTVEIPDGYLIPTVPQRLNYILWIEDLLTVIPSENEIIGIDIGTGPCAIFSLLGAKKNAWRFIATETSDDAIDWAVKNINVNNLDSQIKVVKVSKDSILEEILSPNSHKYDFCLCNPPFFENIDEIRRKHPHVKETIATLAKENEIFSEGGEVLFVKRMIKDSFSFKDRISLFTSMFGKKKSFLEIVQELESIPDVTFTKTEFCQGNTVRWGLAWTFLKGVNFQKWEKPKPKKPKKAKPPLTFQIPINKKSCVTEKIVQQIQNILCGLEIEVHLVKSFPNYAEMQVAANKNTWSHQRRKRRQLMKEVTKIIEDASVSPVKVSTLSQPNLEKNECECSQPITETASKQSISTVSDMCPLYDHPDMNINCIDISLNKDNDNTITNSDTKISEKEKIDSIKFESPILEPSNNLLFSDVTEANLSCGNSPDKIISCQTNEASINEKMLSIRNDTSPALLHKRKRENDDDESSKKAKIDLFSLDDQQIYIKGEVISENNESKRIVIVSESLCMKNTELSTKFNKIDRKFSHKSLLYCYLKLRRRQNHMTLEMNCPLDANRDSMYQVFQLLKNQMVS